MRTLILTNEYPPSVYGGAGVHVSYLTQELSHLMKVDVRCFGNQSVEKHHLSVHGIDIDSSNMQCSSMLKSSLSACLRSVHFADLNFIPHLVHCHTWYTHLGGILTKLHYGIPLVITVHSLEPLRPWKRQQLGKGYDFSLWIEKTALEMADAIIAVSADTKNDILKLFNVHADKIHVIHNGIDTNEYQKTVNPIILKKFGINVNYPYVFFIGRITNQKGIKHFINSINYLDSNVQIVICTGTSDTPEIEYEISSSIQQARASCSNIIWIKNHISKDEIIALYSSADVFVCPSIYEPFGLINLEAMSCELPVVASSVGGIKEVVQHGQTGFLVPFVAEEVSYEPVFPDVFARDLAKNITHIMDNPSLKKEMGLAGRKRAEELFSWKNIALQTKQVYELLLK